MPKKLLKLKYCETERFLRDSSRRKEKRKPLLSFSLPPADGHGTRTGARMPTARHRRPYDTSLEHHPGPSGPAWGLLLLLFARPWPGRFQPDFPARPWPALVPGHVGAIAAEAAQTSGGPGPLEPAGRTTATHSRRRPPRGRVPWMVRARSWPALCTKCGLRAPGARRTRGTGGHAPCHRRHGQLSTPQQWAGSTPTLG